METKRKKFQGVLNILSFNRHYYVIGLVVLVLLTLLHIIIQWSSVLYWITVFAFAYGFIMPLIISAYVYDFSGYYDFNWLNSCNINRETVHKIININAGFDETSFIIKSLFPDSSLSVFDFYNSKQHTEPAIKRARKVSLLYPGTQQIASNLIPLEDKSIDIIFILSAAHEIRSQKERIQFFNECNRLCSTDGQLIIVEHLRDLPNFLAFSIGFTHFFSKKTWKNAFFEAGFSNCKEVKFTPFMSVFICRH